ncbi:MAG: hypothetical protein RJA44_2226, partial [Pseudomonadota bacterium]
IVLAAWLILTWGILPRLGWWRTDIEAWAGRTLQMQLQLDRIEARGGLWAPELHLHGVRLRRPDGQPALQFEQLLLRLTPGTLLPRPDHGWQPQLDALQLDNPELQLRRERSGRILIGGLPLTPAAAPDADDDTLPEALQWLLRQPLLQIRGGRLIWHDERRDVAPLALEQLDLQLRHAPDGRHTLQLSTRLPPGWRAGDTTDARLRLQGGWQDGTATLTRWRDWHSQWQLDLPPTELGQLQHYLSAGAPLQRGRLALQGRLDIEAGQLRTLTLQPRIEAATLQFGARLQPLQLRQLRADLQLQRQPDGWQAALHELSWRSANGLVWSPSELMLTLQQPEDGPLQGGTLQASRLDLDTLGHLAAHLPLAGPLRRLIETAAPQGRAHDLQYQWRGSFEQPSHYAAQGRAEGLSLRAATPDPAEPARPVRPGIEQADLDFSLDQSGGQARLQLHRGALIFPGVFEDARVPLDHLDARLRWQIGRQDALPHAAAPALQVRILRADFANADARGHLSGRWQTGQGHADLPGRIDLQTLIDAADATRVHRYLPLSLPESVRRYVRDAVQTGRIRQARAEVHGALLDFPYADPQQGRFELQGQVEQARLDYVPAGPQDAAAARWPALHGIDGQLQFSGRSMALQAERARVDLPGAAFELGPVDGDISDFAHQPTLRLHGQGRGPAAQLLAFVRRSPVGGWLAHALDPAEATGASQLDLHLALPLQALADSEVDGLIQLTDASLLLHPDTPRLDAVQAGLHFDTRSFELRQASARALGGALRLSGGLPAGGALAFSAEGTAEAAELARSALIPPLLRPLLTPLRGRSDYQLDLSFPGGTPAVRVRSDLRGISADLPAPLAKPAAEARAFELTLTPQPAAAPASDPAADQAANPAAERHWQVRLGELLDLQLQLQDDPAGPRLLRGGVGLASPAPTPAEGLDLRLHWPQLDLPAWLSWVERQWPQLHAPAATDPAAAAATTDPAGAATRAVVRSYLPRHIDLQAAQLKLPLLPLDAVRLQLQRHDATASASHDHWQAEVQARQLTGSIELHTPGDTATPGVIVPRAARTTLQARLAHLDWSSDPSKATDTGTSPPEPANTGSAPASALDSQQLPNLDLQIEQLSVQGHPLGRLQLQAGAVDQAEPGWSAGDWRLEQATLQHPDATLQAQGGWHTQHAGPGGRTRLDWQLDLRDSGALLGSFGLVDALRGAAGQVSGQLHWAGLPQQARLHGLGGQAHLELGPGQVLQADPGAARLVGVLNLQSLPRRLLLDFSDVSQQGFGFDQIDGDIELGLGQARTGNLRVRGLLATVLTSGSADLSLGTQDLQVRVLPELNAGTASLAYATVNPVVGLGTLFGQWLLQQPLSEAAMRAFRITGSFDAPLVEAADSPLPTP